MPLGLQWMRFQDRIDRNYPAVRTGLSATETAFLVMTKIIAYLTLLGEVVSSPIMGTKFQERPGPLRRPVMAWALLVAAGAFEVIWSFFMKQSQSFTKTTPTVLTILTVLASLGLLSMAMKTLPLGTAYMIWTGIG